MPLENVLTKNESQAVQIITEDNNDSTYNDANCFVGLHECNLLLDIDLKNPFEMSDSGNKIIRKVNRTRVFPLEKSRKFPGWHARKKRDHLHCVGGRLKDVTTRICACV